MTADLTLFTRGEGPFNFRDLVPETAAEWRARILDRYSIQICWDGWGFCPWCRPTGGPADWRRGYPSKAAAQDGALLHSFFFDRNDFFVFGDFSPLHSLPREPCEGNEIP